MKGYMQIIQGDLVKAVLSSEDNTPQVMLHVCNNAGVMGSGIALQVKNQIPAAYRAYKEYESQWGVIHLGTISMCENVINLHSQDGYGKNRRHLDYEALYRSLEKAAIHIERNNIERVGIPYRMGSDRAGGDWRIVMAMVDSVFTYGKNPYVNVNIYKL